MIVAPVIRYIREALGFLMNITNLDQFTNNEFYIRAQMMYYNIIIKHIHDSHVIYKDFKYFLVLSLADRYHMIVGCHLFVR